MNIGNRIKDLRLAKNLGFNEFAAIGGVSERSQRMYEGNKTPPTTEYCSKIAEKFKDVNMDWLLTGEGTMLKGGGANDELNLSREELEFIKMLRGMSEYQKNDTLKTAENFIKSNREIIERYSRGDLRMAA